MGGRVRKQKKNALRTSEKQRFPQLFFFFHDKEKKVTVF